MASPSHSGGTYVVQRGDTLSSIAARYGVSASSLQQLNGISNANLVIVGQRLRIPGSSSSSGGQAAAPAASGGVHVVKSGETLARIAAAYGVSVNSIVRANGLANANVIYPGQRLIVSGASGGSSGSSGGSSSGSSGGIHIVKAGETLGTIARKYGTSVNTLVALNGLANANYIWIGQRLKVTGSASGGGSSGGSGSGGSGKWIDVNLSQQRLTAYQGNTAVFSALISGGLPRTPTVTGRFRILTKLVSTRMRGPGYDLPNVPYAMYFYKGYAIHGTYWHSNFGHPMSHGCVNMSTADAGWVFNWAPVGTLVVSHW